MLRAMDRRDRSPAHQPLRPRWPPALAAWLLSAAAQAAEPVVLEPVVVTATRHPTLALSAPASTSVVNARELQAGGADDVLDALRGEAGVSLQGRAIGGRKVISLRGLDSKHTLFLIDGRRVGASDGVVGHSDFQYDWIAVDDIERIEVVRGPLSVLYGSEAMGGVVNIITRRATEQWRATARAEGSRAAGGRGGDGDRAAVAADGPLGEHWSLRAGAAHSRRDAVASTDDPGLSELEGQRKADGWLALAWRPRAGHRLDLEHRRGSELRRADARERGGARRYHVSENEIERRLGSIGWEAEWGGAAAEAQSQLRAYESVIEVDNRRSAGVSVNPRQVLGERVLEGQWRTTHAAHGLTAGFEARNESLHDPGLPDGRSLARQRSLYLQDEIALGRDVQLTAGLRHDRHDLFGHAWSPRAYLVWQPNPAWVFKGGISRGFKAPNLKQIVPGVRREGPNSFIGNPDLRPETSNGVEIGTAWARPGRELQFVLFAQRIEKLIEVQLVAPGPVPGIGTYTYENVSRARLRGFEFSVAQQLPAGFGAQFNWTWLDARDGAGAPLLRRSRHAVGARLDWQRGAWQAGLRADYGAGQWLPSATAGEPAQRAPALTLLGVHATRSFGKAVALTLGVDNLTDLRPAQKSALYTHAEAPRTWRMALRAAW